MKRIAAPLSILACAPVAFGQAQPMPSTPELPGYKLLRQDEDWSKFVETPGGDTFDPLKHIQVGEKAWLSVGARIEARNEQWDGFGFGGLSSAKNVAPAQVGTPTKNSDNFTLSRMLAHGDLTIGEHLRAYVELMTAQSTDRDLQGGRRVTDMDSFAFQQAWFDLKTTDGTTKLRLRTGRQSFGFGNQRLISSLPWANTLNRWDGFTSQWSRSNWTVNGLLTWYVPVDKTHENLRDDDKSLYGLYATRTPQPGETGLDLYVLGTTRADVKVSDLTGDERRHTLGSRMWGSFAERGDWEVEGGWQVGELGASDVNAWFFTTVTGWKLDTESLSPRIFAGIDLASGDRKPGGELNTFYQLYPLGHLYLGYADTVSRQNIAAAHVGASIKPGAATTVTLTLHTLNLMSDQDAIYQLNGSIARPVPASGAFKSKHIGEELDLLVQHRLYRHLDFYGGYSHVFTGDAVAETGEADDIDFLYLGMIFTF